METPQGALPPSPSATPPEYVRQSEEGGAVILTGGYSHSIVPGGFEVTS